MTKKVLFLDRDGTLNVEPEDFQVDALDKVALVPGAIPALLALKDVGYRFVMITNQDGLGTDSFPEPQFTLCQDYIIALYRSQGIEFDEIFVCPHFEADGCDVQRIYHCPNRDVCERTTPDETSGDEVGENLDPPS